MKLTTREIALIAGKIALSKKASEVKVLDLRGLTSVTDYFVLCSGELDVHVKAISDAIVEGLRKKKLRVWHVEGYDARRWVLLDYVDIVVHVFDHEARQFYGLERLWGDAPVELLDEQMVESSG